MRPGPICIGGKKMLNQKERRCSWAWCNDGKISDFFFLIKIYSPLRGGEGPQTITQISCLFLNNSTLHVQRLLWWKEQNGSFLLYSSVMPCIEVPSLFCFFFFFWPTFILDWAFLCRVMPLESIIYPTKLVAFSIEPKLSFCLSSVVISIGMLPSLVPCGSTSTEKENTWDGLHLWPGMKQLVQ